MFALYNAIREISADAGIGLKLGSEERPERYSPIAIAAEPTDPAALLARADAALYAAKRAGRNRYELAPAADLQERL